MQSSGTLSIPLNSRFDPSEFACEFISLLARDLQRMAAADSGCENSVSFTEFMKPELALKDAFLQ